MPTFRSLALASLVAAALCAVAADSKPRAPEWIDSDDQQHRWLIRDRRQWVGLHNDQIGTWIDLRSAEARSYPEFAIVVPHDGGSPRLQVCQTNGDPITVDLVKAARILARLIDKEQE